MKFKSCILFTVCYLSCLSVTGQTFYLIHFEQYAGNQNPVPLYYDTIVSAEAGGCEVKFALVDTTQPGPGPGSPPFAITGTPHVVFVGSPEDAFRRGTAALSDCTGLTTQYDNPDSSANSGCAFLTDIPGLSHVSNMDALLVEYVTPTHHLSASILDVDAYPLQPDYQCEAWIIECYDAAGNSVAGTTVISACNGLTDPNVPMSNINVVTGDGQASTFNIHSLTTAIKYMIIRYHPNATRTTYIGLAFDNFYCTVPKMPSFIFEEKYSEEMLISPNPAKDHAMVHYSIQPQLDVRYDLLVTDLAGRAVYSMKLEYNEDQVLVPTTSLSSGTYIMMLKANGYVVQSGRFVVQK